MEAESTQTVKQVVAGCILLYLCTLKRLRIDHQADDNSTFRD